MHGRLLYSCGCVKAQCRCPGPHTDMRLDYPCPKHVGQYAVQFPQLKAIAEAVLMRQDLSWQLQRQEDEDRERLIAEVWD